MEKIKNNFVEEVYKKMCTDITMIEMLHAQGYCVSEIAKRCNLKESTVQSYFDNK